MKRNASVLLTVLCIVLGSLCLGFYAGRNLTASPVQVTYIQKSSVQATVPQEASTAGFPVNINTATQAELMTLPGIGEVLSGRILDYRESVGPFGSVTELLYVEGIGEERLEELLPYATIGG